MYVLCEVKLDHLELEFQKFIFYNFPNNHYIHYLLKIVSILYVLQ